MCSMIYDLYGPVCKIIDADRHNLILFDVQLWSSLYLMDGATGQGSLCLDWLSVIMIVTVMMIMTVITLTWRTGDGRTALVLGFLHHTVLTNWLDKWAHPRKKSFKTFF